MLLVGLGVDLQLWNADTREYMHPNKVPYDMVDSVWVRDIIDMWKNRLMPHVELFAKRQNLDNDNICLLYGLAHAAEDDEDHLVAFRSLHQQRADQERRTADRAALGRKFGRLLAPQSVDVADERGGRLDARLGVGGGGGDGAEQVDEVDAECDVGVRQPRRAPGLCGHRAECDGADERARLNRARKVASARRRAPSPRFRR